MPATMSVRGLYSWDDTIFESMQVPSGFTEDDKEILVDNILIETAELECVYSSPEFLAVAIDRWSRKELPTWERIYRVANMEYNPIENYNRLETSTETTESTQQHTGSDATAHTGTDTETHGGTDTETNSGSDSVSSTNTTRLQGTDTEGHSGTDTTLTKKYAFDTNSAVDTESVATTNGHTVTRGMDDTTTVTGSGSTTFGHQVATQHGETVAMQHGETVTDTYGHKVDDTGEITRESHISGNIGVTTSQAMAEAEILVSAKLNVYNYIIQSFIDRFCLQVF